VAGVKACARLGIGGRDRWTGRTAGWKVVATGSTPRVRTPTATNDGGWYRPDVDTVHVELVFFDDCPSWEEAWRELGRALAATEVAAHVLLVNVADAPLEDQRGFAGSPTIRMDGRDLEGYDGQPVLACRRYAGNGNRGWPSQEQLREALTGAADPDVTSPPR